MDNIPIVCPTCHQTIDPGWYFCPNCGRDLKPEAVRISVWSEVGVYALSILLPPLGLWPGIKYLMKESRDAKRVGIVAIVLTLVSSAVTVWLIMNSLNNYLSQFKGLVY